MANSLPFNAVAVDGEYDRVYKAEDWAWYFATFIANGIFPNLVYQRRQAVAKSRLYGFLAFLLCFCYFCNTCIYLYAPLGFFASNAVA